VYKVSLAITSARGDDNKVAEVLKAAAIQSWVNIGKVVVNNCIKLMRHYVAAIYAASGWYPLREQFSEGGAFLPLWV
jgi:hypothetical protein